MKNLFVCTDADSGKWGLWTQNPDGSVDLVSDLFRSSQSVLKHAKKNGIYGNIDFEHPFGMTEEECDVCGRCWHSAGTKVPQILTELLRENENYFVVF